MVDTGVLQDPDFWCAAWEKSNEHSPQRRRIRQGEEAIEFWNKMAPDYEKHSAGRRRSVCKGARDSHRRGMLTPETGLDVGCGPGMRYSWPDGPAGNRFGRCRRNVPASREKRRKRDCKTSMFFSMWEDIDLEKEAGTLF